MNELKLNNVKAVRFATSEKSGIKEKISKFGSVLGLVLLCIVLSVISSDFLTVKNIMNITSQASITCLISMGMLLAILTAGIDLSVGSMLALSSCLMGIAIVKWNWNPFVAILLCLAMGLFLGLINGLLLTKLRLPHPFISTMGMKNVARGLALIITAESPISGFPKSVLYLGGGFIGVIPVSFILVIFVCGAFYI